MKTNEVMKKVVPFLDVTSAITVCALSRGCRGVIATAIYDAIGRMVYSQVPRPLRAPVVTTDTIMVYVGAVGICTTSPEVTQLTQPPPEVTQSVNIGLGDHNIPVVLQRRAKGRLTHMARVGQEALITTQVDRRPRDVDVEYTRRDKIQPIPVRVVLTDVAREIPLRLGYSSFTYGIVRSTEETQDFLMRISVVVGRRGDTSGHNHGAKPDPLVGTKEVRSAFTTREGSELPKSSASSPSPRTGVSYLDVKLRASGEGPRGAVGPGHPPAPAQTSTLEFYECDEDGWAAFEENLGLDIEPKYWCERPVTEGKFRHFVPVL